MKKISGAACLLAMSIVFAATGVAAAGTDTQNEVAAIQAVDEVFVKAYNSGDVATVVAQYDDHAVLQAPGSPEVVGKAAIRTYFSADIPEAAKAGAKFVLNPGATGGVSADLGWSSGTFLVKGKAGEVLDKGKYLSVSRKVNGKWLYVRDMWNSDAAPAAPGPAAPAKK